jgi:hypothetical protein
MGAYSALSITRENKMKTVFISLMSTLLISNIAWGQPASETTSNTASKSEAIATQAKHTAKAYKPYTNESQKNNSLFRGALAIHQMNVKRAMKDQPKQIITTAKPYTNASEKHNSLARAALAIHEMNVKIFSTRLIDYTPNSSTDNQNSSFISSILEKKR